MNLSSRHYTYVANTIAVGLVASSLLPDQYNLISLLIPYGTVALGVYLARYGSLPENAVVPVTLVFLMLVAQLYGRYSEEQTSEEVFLYVEKWCLSGGNHETADCQDALSLIEDHRNGSEDDSDWDW